MSGMLLTVESWGFFLVSTGLFVLLAIIAYQKKAAAAFVILLAAVFSATFVYLDHISEIAATATSLTIKVREASDALVGLRRLAALTGSAVISLDSQSGSIGGYTAHDLDQRKQEVLDTLRSIGVDQTTIKQVKGADRARDLADYGISIVNHIRDCVLSGPRQAEWDREVSTGASGWPPTPDVLQRLLDKFNVHDPFVDKALAEYRHYALTGDHQDLQFWHDRDSWPTMPTKAGSSCAS